MLDVRRDYLVAPSELPDGTVSWEEQRPSLAQRVRDGDATYGWAGDPRLSLCMNLTYVAETGDYKGPAWEVWRRHEDGTASLVMRKKGARIDDGTLLRLLAEHDTWHVDVALRLGRERQAASNAADAAFGDECEDKADRLAHALAQDLSIPAPDGKLYPLGGD